MSLSEIIARRTAASTEDSPGDTVTPEPQEEPWGVARSVTPSGLEIYYQAGPKRLYRVDGGEVPSVSTILEVLDKGGLSWWGMTIGVQGIAQLLERKCLAWDDERDDPCFRHQTALSGMVEWEDVKSTEGLVELLKTHKLTVNHVKKDAADRGTNVHSALESWYETGTIPDPQFYPEHERGYVQGLVEFLTDADPIGRMSEVMVASNEHGYAGRFDMVAHIEGDVVVKAYPKRPPKRAQVSGTWLLDLKTSKGVYPSYHLQLAAYRAALLECGYEPVDHAGVVRVTADGRYELVEGRAFHDQFLSVLAVHHAIKEIGS